MKHLVWPLMDLLLALVSAAFLVHIRRKCRASTYVLVCLPLALLLAWLWAYSPVIHDRTTSGYDTWSLLAGYASMIVVCAYEMRVWWAKALQVVASALVCEAWILLTSFAH